MHGWAIPGTWYGSGNTFIDVQYIGHISIGMVSYNAESYGYDNIYYNNINKIELNNNSDSNTITYNCHFSKESSRKLSCLYVDINFVSIKLERLLQ